MRRGRRTAWKHVKRVRREMDWFRAEAYSGFSCLEGVGKITNFGSIFFFFWTFSRKNANPGGGVLKAQAFMVVGGQGPMHSTPHNTQGRRNCPRAWPTQAA